MDMPRTVLITGCTPGGIGHCLAREFKSHGLRVFATARKAESINDLKDQGIETLSLEVIDLDSIKALKDEVSSRTGGTLDILVNNAGQNMTVPALDLEPDQIRAVFETNVVGVMLMCKTFAPLLINAKGTIVQIGSLAAVMSYVWGAAYGATKAALHSYSNSLRLELAPFDVRVVTVVTGGVKSNIARTHRDLRQDSLYLPLQHEYETRLTHSQTMGMQTESYAKTVVQTILGSPKKNQIWAGGSSWAVWFLTFFPRAILDYYFTYTFKLNKLRGTLSKKLA